MDWARELDPEELVAALDGDAALLADAIGVEGLLMMWQKLTGLSIYISTKPQMEAKRRYIHIKHDGNNTKDLALELGVSERFVQMAAKDSRHSRPSLFDFEEEEK
jgi:hypothetical protein